MSHQITQKDTCFTLEPAWHGLETVVKAINYETSGLNWTVEKRDLRLVDEDIEVPGFQAVYCPEKETVINVSKESYKIIQNSQMFEVIENSLNGVDYNIVSAGSLGGLKRVYISVELCDHQEYVVNKDKFKNFLTFFSSHDGSSAFEAYDTSLRVVCANTLQWSRQNKGLLNLKVRHTANNKLKIEDMERQIERLFQKREEFYKTYAGLYERAMSVEEAEKVIAGFFATEEAEELSTRAENQMNEILRLFQCGMGNKGETQADLLNAFTEYYTHGATDNKRKAYASSEFGSFRNKKLEAWELFSDNQLDDLAAKGAALLMA